MLRNRFGDALALPGVLLGEADVVEQLEVLCELAQEPYVNLRAM